MAIIGDSFFIMQKQIACRFINLNILLIIFNTIFREVSTDSIESEKVRRLCRFGQNLPLSERIQPENLFPFTSVQWTPTAAETSD